MYYEEKGRAVQNVGPSDRCSTIRRTQTGMKDGQFHGPLVTIMGPTGESTVDGVKCFPKLFLLQCMSNDLHALYQLGNTGRGVRSLIHGVDSPKSPRLYYVSNRMASTFIAGPDSCLVSL